MCQVESISFKGFYEATDFDAFFKAHLIFISSHICTYWSTVSYTHCTGTSYLDTIGIQTKIGMVMLKNGIETNHLL